MASIIKEVWFGFCKIIVFLAISFV